jgi:hypothetical protein
MYMDDTNDATSVPELTKPVITHTVFNKNSAKYGGGVRINDGQPSFSLTMISGNTSGIDGGGLAVYRGLPMFNRTVINGNAANDGGGGGIFIHGVSTSPVFTNTLVSGNTAKTGGGIYNNSGASLVINVTVAGNYASSDYGGIFNWSSTAKYYNTLAWDNTPIQSSHPASIDRGNCGNIFLDSQLKIDSVFVDPKPATAGHPETGGDYRLHRLSPAMDMGDSKWLTDPSVNQVDLFGDARIQGCRIDMGAYESPHTPELNPDNGRIYVTETGAGDKDGSSWDDAYPGLAYPLQMAAQAGCTEIKEIWVAKGAYYPRFHVGDGHNDMDRTFLMAKGVKLYGGFAGDESSIDERKTTVNEHQIIQMVNKSILSGDFLQNDVADNFNTNKADNAYHIVVAVGEMAVANDTARLDGFTVTKGSATVARYTDSKEERDINGILISQNYGGGVIIVNASPIFAYDSIAENNVQYHGGGMYMDDNDSPDTEISELINPVIMHTIFNKNNMQGSGNDHYGGGGVYISDGKPSFSRTMMSGNIASVHGGGLYVYTGFPVFNHTVIIGNTATGSGASGQGSGGGGGVYIFGMYAGYDANRAKPMFANTLVSGNTAHKGGGIYDNGISSFVNVTVAGNFAPQYGGYGGIYNLSTVVFRNTVVWNNSPVNTSTGKDPIAANVSNTLIEGVTLAGTANFSGDTDPLFISPDPATSITDVKTGGDYRLQSGSPVIDKGDKSYNTTPHDLDGNARVQGCKIELGAYESVAPMSVQPDGAGRVYVTVAGAGTMDGSSWANAYPGLADPLRDAASATCIEEIWVAEGTYYPQHPADGASSDNHDKAFVMVKGVKIYGGFVGGEDELSDRITTVNEHGVVQMKYKSILSGDFSQNDISDNFSTNKNDNAYHVVVAAGEMIEGIDTARLDGFTITGGNANTSSSITVNSQQMYGCYGGGVIIINASPIFAYDSIAENNATYCGGGMFMDDVNGADTETSIPELTKPVITHTVFNKNNLSTLYPHSNNGGGGVYIYDGQPSISRTMISGNISTSHGGGVYINAGLPVFNRTVINGNVAAENGGGMYISGQYPRPVVTNTLISGNTAKHGGGIYSVGSSSFINVTVAGNFASSSYGGIYNSYNTAKFYNTLAWDNTPVYPSISSTLSVGNFGNNFLDSRLNIDSMFVASKPATAGHPETGGNYRLHRLSPAMDMGDNSRLTDPSVNQVDLFGDNRIQGCRIDIGAYESPHTPELNPTADGRVYVTETGAGAKDGSSWDNAYHGLAYPLHMAAKSVCPAEIKEIWVAKGAYYPRFYAGEAQTDMDRAFTLAKGVKVYGGFVGTESSIDERKTTVNEHNIIQMANKSILSGDFKKDDVADDFNTNKTDNVHHVVVVAGEMIEGIDTARLDGFTITGGNANVSGNITVNSQTINRNYGGGVVIINASPIIIYDSIAENNAMDAGGGMFMDDVNGADTDTSIPELTKPVITHTVFNKNNTTVSGGGLYISDGYPSISLTMISGNIATGEGGGLYVYRGSPMFNRTVINGNAVTTGRGGGGGMYLYGLTKSVVTNTLISGNTAGDGGGISNSSASSFINVTVAGNFASWNGGINNRSATAKFYNTLAWNNTPVQSSINSDGTLQSGNFSDNFIDSRLNIDSVFVDPKPATAGHPETGGNYRLHRLSPAMDMGDNSWLADPSVNQVDLFGDTRIQGCRIDIGAYESPHIPELNPTAGRVYVTETGAGNKDGSSWANAYPGLAYPLYMAAKSVCPAGIKEIWVAKGTYYPRFYAAADAQTDMDRAFVMVKGVKLYGGFAGDESSIDERAITINEHNIIQMANKSILSGDFLQDDVASNFNTKKDDNVHHVVVAAGEMIEGTDTARLDGFTITGGNANVWSSRITVNSQQIDRNYGGGVIIINASPIFIYDSIVENNALYYGGGMYMDDINGSDTETSIPELTKPVITHTVFNKNNIGGNSGNGGGVYINDGYPSFSLTMISGNISTQSGGGLFINAGLPVFNRTVINGNTAIKSGGGMHLSGTSYYKQNPAKPVFTNTLISGNTAKTGGGVSNDGTPSFINVTVAGNFASSEYGGIYNTSTTAKFYNTLAWDNTPIQPSIRTSTDRNNFDNNFLDSRLNSDPVFVDSKPATAGHPETGGDYRLHRLSPAMDMGDNSWLIDPSVNQIDLFGDARIQGCRIDIGAYESPHNPQLNPDNGRIYVTETGAGDKDGSSWSNAYPGFAYPLHMAAKSACPTEIKEIWVAQGTYYPRFYAGDAQTDMDRTFVMTKGVKLYGGFAGVESSTDERKTTINEHNIIQMANKSILNGDFLQDDAAGDFNTNKADNVYHVVVAAGEMIEGSDTARLDGFTITGGNADASDNITVNSQTINRNYGGGIAIINASPIIMYDSIAENNAMENGGGMFMDDNGSPDTDTSIPELTRPVITHTIFNRNNIKKSTSAPFYGGGVSIWDGQPYFSRTMISGNISASNGGGLYVYRGLPVFNRTVINGNTAAYSGGGMYFYVGAKPVFTNTLISGNTAQTGGGVFNNSNVSSFINVTVAGNFASANNGYGGIHNYSDRAKFYNTLAWDNMPVTTTIGTNPPAANVSNTLIQGVTLAGTANLSGDTDPLFMSPDPATSITDVKTGGDYRLQSGSPVIDKGRQIV